MIQKHKVTLGIEQAKHNVNMIGQIDSTFAQPARDVFPESSRILAKYKEMFGGFLFLATEITKRWFNQFEFA